MRLLGGRRRRRRDEKGERRDIGFFSPFFPSSTFPPKRRGKNFFCVSPINLHRPVSFPPFFLGGGGGGEGKVK